MSSLRTPRPTSAEDASLIAICVATGIVAAALLAASWLFACADNATTGVSSEHGASYCPECHEGGERK